MKKHLELDTNDLITIIADYCHCDNTSDVFISIHGEEIKVVVDVNRSLTIK